MKTYLSRTLAACLLAALCAVVSMPAAQLPEGDLDPRPVGWWPGYLGTPSSDVGILNFMGVAVRGNHAYLADEPTGLRVFDVSDPSRPRLTGTADSAGYPQKVAITGNYAMVAAANSGLEIYDITKPENPHRIAIHPTDPYPLGIAISGTHAYVALGEGGVEIVDIGDPAKPKHAAIYKKSKTTITHVTIANDIAMLVNFTGSLIFVDVSDPTTPRELSVLRFPEGSTSSAAFGGRYAYAAVNRGRPEIYAIDLLDPRNPVLVPGPLTTIDSILGGVAHAMVVQDNVLYATVFRDALYVFDLEATPALRRKGAFLPQGDNFQCAIAGDHAIIAAGAGGLQTVRLDIPAISSQLGKYVPRFNRATAVTVKGSNAYIGTSGSVLEIVDISNPVTPPYVAAFDNQGVGPSATRVSVSSSGSIVVGGPRLPLAIVDVSNPALPKELGRIPTSFQNAQDFVLEGNLVYLATSPGLVIMDITDPTNIGEIGHLDTPGSTRGIAVGNNLAYVTGNFTGIKVVDIADPSHPTLLKQIPARGSGPISFHENMLFVLGAGMEIFDVRDVQQPKLLGQFDSPKPQGVVLAGHLAYLADDILGLRIVDISDPARPRYIGGNSAFGATQIAISGGRVYVAGKQGLYICDGIAGAPHLGNPAFKDGSFHLWLYGASGEHIQLQRGASVSAWQDWESTVMSDTPKLLTSEADHNPQFFRAIAR